MSRAVLLAALIAFAARGEEKQPEKQAAPAAPEVGAIRPRPKLPERLRVVENQVMSSGDNVNADDVLDEILDEFGADMARLGASRTGPILLERVRLSESMNPAYAAIVEARLAAAIFRAANVAVVRCQECWATRATVENGVWVVRRGLPRREDVQAIAKAYKAQTLLDVSLSLQQPSALTMDVELVRADDSSIAFAEGYRFEADHALLYRGADRAQTREQHLRELEDRINQRPHLMQEVQLGSVMIPDDSHGTNWSVFGRFILAEEFGDSRQYAAGLGAGGLINSVFAGGVLSAHLQLRLTEPRVWSSEVSLFAEPGVLITGNTGNSPIVGGGVRWLMGTRIALHASLNYLVPFQVRGKGPNYGGVVPEIGGSLVWR